MPYKNIEDKKAYSKAYHLKNKDKRAEYGKRYKEANPEKFKGYRRRTYENSKQFNYRNDPAFRMLNSSKQRAVKKGLEHTITKEDIIIPTHCPVLGVPIEPILVIGTVGRTTNPRAPSLDRIDNSLGYVKGNIRVISHQANALKGANTIETLEAIIQYMRSASA